MPIITLFGDKGIFWIAAALLLIIIKKTRKTGVMMGTALLLGLIIGNLILKNAVARTRPYDVNIRNAGGAACKDAFGLFVPIRAYARFL